MLLAVGECHWPAAAERLRPGKKIDSLRSLGMTGSERVHESKGGQERT